MKKIILITAFIFNSFSVNASSEIDRKDLFNIADQSLYFFLSAAFLDQSLTAKLTQEEGEMAFAVFQVLHQKKAIEWSLNKKIPLDTSSNYPVMSYGDYGNQTFNISLNGLIAPSLEFSNDQEIFKLHPNEPVRTAVTSSDFNSKIYVNLKKINAQSAQIDLASTVSLLIHEYGHKIYTAPKNQKAIDSFAAKVESLMRSKISEVELKNGDIVSFIQYKRFGPLIKYLQNIQNGHQLVQSWYFSIMNVVSFVKQHELAFWDEEGFYLWVDQKGKIKDLSKNLFRHLSTTDLVGLSIPKNLYQKAYQNVVVTSKIEVNESVNESLKIHVSGAFFQIAQPFMIPGTSPNPQDIDLDNIAYNYAGPFGQFPFTQVLTFNERLNDISEPTPILNSVIMPDLSIEDVKVKKSKDLAISLKINGPVTYQSKTAPLGTMDDPIELWPFLNLKLGEDNNFAIPAHSFDRATGMTQFIIKNLPQDVYQNIVIPSLYFKIPYFSLADDNTGFQGVYPLKKPIRIEKNSSPLSQSKLYQISFSKDKMTIKYTKDKHRPRAIRLLISSKVNVYRQFEASMNPAIVAKFPFTYNIHISLDDTPHTKTNEGIIIDFKNLFELEKTDTLQFGTGQEFKEIRKTSKTVDVFRVDILSNSFIFIENKLNQPAIVEVM